MGNYRSVASYRTTLGEPLLVDVSVNYGNVLPLINVKCFENIIISFIEVKFSKVLRYFPAEWVICFTDQENGPLGYFRFNK